MVLLTCFLMKASVSNSTQQPQKQQQREEEGPPSDAPATVTTELCALPLNTNNANASTQLKWVKVTYPADVLSCDDVTMADASGMEELGAWDGLELGHFLQLAMKRFGDSLYGLVNLGGAPDAGNGCCADTLRVWARNGTVRDIDLVTPLEKTFPSSSYDYASHTFDLSLLDGELVAFLSANYKEGALNGAVVDVVVAVSTVTGEVVPTKDGKQYFSLYEELGTMSKAAQDTIYRIPFYVAPNASSSSSDSDSIVEEWHINGVERFTTQTDHVDILAVTHRLLSELILISDPWTTQSAMEGGGGGGGEILQRFGVAVPGTGGEVRHTFGVDAEGPLARQWSGVHNVRHHWNPFPPAAQGPMRKQQGGGEGKGGRESVATLVNGITGFNGSFVFEFDLRLSPESQAAQPLSDAAFATSYRAAQCPFAANAQGGARAIGNPPQGSGAAGVWLVGAGTATEPKHGLGIACVDNQGGYKQFSAAGNVYDSFTYITLE